MNSQAGSVLSKGRGRPRIPESWSRVISIQHDDLEKLRVHELAPDLMMGSALSGIQSKVRGRKWEPLFCSKAFLRQHTQIQLEAYRLDDK